MKHILQIGLVLLLLATSGTAKAAVVDAITPKREMRSAWVATVWGIDWPQSTSNGTASSIQTQKNQMTRMLDSLAVNNFNAVNFQVRGMSDAMYKSSYEPWASWLTGTRGKDPGWDPFEFFAWSATRGSILTDSTPAHRAVAPAMAPDMWKTDG